MILSDFLSRQMHMTLVICMKLFLYHSICIDALYETYYRVEPTARYLVQTWLPHTKASRSKFTGSTQCKEKLITVNTCL